MAVAANNERRITGLPISDGVVLASVHIIESAGGGHVPYYRIGEDAVASEKARLKTALESAAAHLATLIDKVTRRIGPAQANIFLAQKLMVEDEALHTQIFEIIENELINAEAALEKSLDAYESLLLELDNEYLKERASDIGEIRRRLLELLTQTAAEERPAAGVGEFEGHRIVVAEELTPGETVSLDPQKTVGFITERGGAGSHMAILARALGIPAVTGIKNVTQFFRRDEHVLLNGSSGEVILNPSDTTLSLHPAARTAATRRLRSVPPVDGLVVMANMSVTVELPLIADAQAEGIGLYRTEYEFLAAGRLLTEDEQYERYAAVVKAMDGRPTHFRLLDMGGDKTAEFLNLPHQENPCLGYRGARLLLGHTDLLIPQARALARASKHGPVHVIYPMIVDLDQFLRLREIFRQYVRDIDAGEIRHGVMFEVPSACLAAREILEVAEFGSIGSNDLIQYLFAVDRNNDLVASEYNPDRPVFWELLSSLVDAARDAGRPLSLCGELGGQPAFLPRLLETGINRVSVSSRLIGLARITARRFQ